MTMINDLKRHTETLRPALANAAARVIDGGWFIFGPETSAFESEFAAYCGAASCVGVANGTDALELALRSVGVDPGDSVATVANAGGYGLHAINAIGAIPVFIDVDPMSMNMSPDRLQNLLGRSPRPRAVIFTHLYGAMTGIDTVAALCAQHRVTLVEDCAQAHGAMLANKRAGTWGTVGCFSFYPTKNLGALGDGGAVITSENALATRVRDLRQYGWTKSKYVSEVAGARNSRLDELQAAFLRVKLPRLDGWNARRRSIAARYNRGLRGLPIALPAAAESADDQSYVGHLYVVRTPRRQSLAAALTAKGIGSDVHYPIPDHVQTTCPKAASSSRLPVTEALAAEVLTLPCYPEMTDSEVEAVIAAVQAWAASDQARAG